MKKRIVREKRQETLEVPSVSASRAETRAVADEEVAVAAAKRSRDVDTGSATAYTLYLREIGQTSLITPQQEVQLAKRIQAGDGEARET